MIRLNADGRTLFRPNSWTELYEMPGHRLDVDLSSVKLKEIIGDYSLEPRQPCGLSACRRGHNRGYVAALEDGGITNIGNVCGKKHFGVEWGSARSAFKREANAQRKRETISEAQPEVAALQARLALLKQACGAGDSAYETAKRQLTRLFDGTTADRLGERARRNETRVVQTRETSKEERERGAPRFEETLLFIISGLKAVISYKRLSATQLRRLWDEFEEFSNVDVDSATFDELKSHASFANRMHQVVDQLELAVEDCQRFVARENIERINGNKRYI